MEESDGEIDEPMVLRPLKLEESSVKLLRQDAASKEVAQKRRPLKLKVQHEYPPLSMESLVADTPRAVVTCSMILVVFLNQFSVIRNRRRSR